MRVVRGLASLAVLVIVVVGAPLLLLRVGSLAGLAAVTEGRLWVPDDGTFIVSLLTLAGWFAWALFTASVFADVLERLPGRRPVHLPVVGLLRPLTSTLVIAVVALLAVGGTAPLIAAAQPVPPERAPVVAEVTPRAPAERNESARSVDGYVYTVQTGDDLWSLAERFYGDGRAWRTIADANRDVLTGGPDVLLAGWRLNLPGVEAPTRVQVERGDTLRGLAAKHLGSAERWSDLYRANRDVITNPDVLQPGWVLDLPAEGGGVPDRPPVERTQREERESRPVPPTPESATPAPATATATPEPPTAPDGHAQAEDELGWPAVAALGALGLATAGLVSVRLARRRANLLAVRPLGRRIRHADAAAQRLEAACATAAAETPLRALQGARRAVTNADRRAGRPTRLAWAQLSRDEVALRVTSGEPPTVAQTDGQLWRLRATPPDACPADADQAFPALVTLGHADSGDVLVDLESCGVLGIVADRADEVLAALRLELESAGIDLLTADEPGDLARFLELAVQRRRALDDATPTAQHARLDERLAPDWPPVILLADAPLGDDLVAAMSGDLGLAAVVLGEAQVTWRVDAHGVGRLDPGGASAPTVRLSAGPRRAIAELLDVTTLPADPMSATTSAPWWREDDATIAPLRPRRAHGMIKESPSVPEPPTDAFHPTVRLLGPIDVTGVRGTPPVKAEKQCLEYCAWLLDHPGATAVEMAEALFVAEGTRRSNMSRLRQWLGANEHGAPYLPEAYSGRILLDPAVSSDWRRLQILVAPGVNRVSGDTLISALQLVRGAPLADAAPMQWRWAEELRSDMSSLVRDIGVVLTRMALVDQDVDLARWAAARALVAAPDDELLLRERVLTEQLAGNRAEVERLCLRLASTARSLGLDLADETVVVMQEALEGRSRSRQA